MQPYQTLSMASCCFSKLKQTEAESSNFLWSNFAKSILSYLKQLTEKQNAGTK